MTTHQTIRATGLHFVRIRLKMNNLLKLFMKLQLLDQILTKESKFRGIVRFFREDGTSKKSNNSKTHLQGTSHERPPFIGLQHDIEEVGGRLGEVIKFGHASGEVLHGLTGCASLQGFIGTMESKRGQELQFVTSETHENCLCHHEQIHTRKIYFYSSFQFVLMYTKERIYSGNTVCRQEVRVKSFAHQDLWFLRITLRYPDISITHQDAVHNCLPLLTG